MTAGRNEPCNQATKALEKLKAAEPEVALLSTLWEVVREGMDTHTVEIAEL